MSKKIFSLDTSALVNAWNKHYQIDMLPTIWEHIENCFNQGIAVSTMQVYLEIKKQDDELHAWCKERKELFTEIDESVLTALQTLMAKYPKLVARGSDRNFADPWVIALAQTTSPLATVVTEEGRSQNMNNPKIPFICKLEKLDCCTFNGFLRETKWRERS